MTGFKKGVNHFTIGYRKALFISNLAITARRGAGGRGNGQN